MSFNLSAMLFQPLFLFRGFGKFGLYVCFKYLLLHKFALI